MKLTLPKFCEDLVALHERRAGRELLHTTFSYPNGDGIVIGARRTGTNLRLDDLLCTMRFFHGSGIRVTSSRTEKICSICASTGATFEDGRIVLTGKVSTAAESLKSIVQAILQVAAIRYDVEDVVASKLRVKVDAVITKLETKKRPVVRNWRFAEKDKAGSFAVDYRVGANGAARNIFVVTQEQRIDHVAATSLFLREVGDRVPSMAVVDPRLALGERTTGRLEQTVSRILFPKTVQQFNEIREFALAA